MRTPEYQPTIGDGLLQLDDLTIDLDGYRIVRGEQVIDLTCLEQRMLMALLEQAGRVVTVPALLAAVWGLEYYGSSDYVRAYVTRLRRKLGEDVAAPRYLQTVYGIGYRFMLSRAHDSQPTPADSERPIGGER